MQTHHFQDRNDHWIDAHNHLHDPRLGDPGPLVAAMKLAGVTRCIVNATREANWPAVENLATAYPDFVVPAFGIHPWHAHTAAAGWQDRLRAMLEKHPHASIGECGLDQWVTDPPLEIQRPVFIEQLRLARELDRPLTIHCQTSLNDLEFAEGASKFSSSKFAVF